MFSKIFIERPRFAMVISIIFVLTGVIALTQLPIAEYPEIAPPQISVSATYSGASASVVAETVAIPIEDELNGVDDLLYFSSTCDNMGNYSCSVTFKSGTDSDMAMVNVQNALKRAESKLPDEVKKVGVNVDKRTGDMLAVFVFMTDGTTYDVLNLNNYVNTVIKDPISRIDGVAAADVMSPQVLSMRIWLKPDRMANLGISTDEIIAAIRAQNVQAAAGTIGSEGSSKYIEYKLNVQGRLKTTEEFGEIVVRNDNGSLVKIKHIAEVKLGPQLNAGRAWYKTQKERMEELEEAKNNPDTIQPPNLSKGESVALAIYRSSDANALKTVEQVKAEIKRLAERFPAGVSYTTAYDPTEFIVISLKEIVTTLIVALLLVVVITWLFLQDWRATLIPSVAIPVSLMATFPVMLALGYSINVLTMFGLILVVGSLCDDAIVVVENCQALMQREKLSPKEAAIKSMQQITGAIIATTLVTVACYAPLAFYGGMVGTIYMQFAVTMCISLCFSTIVAMTLSPALCAILLRPPKEKPGVFFAPFNVVMDASRKVYLFGVKLLVRRAIVTLILFGIVLGGIWFMNKQILSSFLPTEDKGAILVNIDLPPGASLERTERSLMEFRDKVLEVDGVRNILVASGFSILSGRAENAGIAIVQLDHWDDRTAPDKHLGPMNMKIQEVAASIPEADIKCFTPPAIMGLGATGGASFMLSREGDVTPQELFVQAITMAGEISKDPRTLYAMTTYDANTPQLYLDIDPLKAHSKGLDSAMIYSSLQSQLASFYINDFNILGNSFYVKIQSEGEKRATLDDIRNIQIRNKNGDMVPLTSVGELKFMVGPRRIQRFNKLTSAEMNAQGKPGASTGDLIQITESVELPREYHIEWTGMSYQEKENEGQLGKLMLLAIVFAYLFLVAQYESWTIPVPVMMAVAFASLGALIGLYLTGETMSIYAQLGMVMLIGLTAKNAILMVEFSKQERENGVSVYEAAIRGGELRYRAVLMTAWSFLFGVFPLVIAEGAGAASRRAIGITTFSGMLLATVIGIVFTPALYAACQRFREFVKYRILKLKKPDYILKSEQDK
ncbi:MAG: efflux RND transporter permease subunit [Lentisphaerae bacterium]|nr:efflux RND transporter permease subunit [Lentisphaerota bacterium]